MYFVSIFGVGSDRRAGVLLATNSVRPRTSTAKRLRENIPYKAEFRGGKLVFYYKVNAIFIYFFTRCLTAPETIILYFCSSLMGNGVEGTKPLALSFVALPVIYFYRFSCTYRLFIGFQFLAQTKYNFK